MARPTAVICLVLVAFSLQQTCDASYIMTAKKALDYSMKVFENMEKFQRLIEGEFEVVNTNQLEEQDVVQREIYKQLEMLSTDFQDLRDRILDKISNQLRDKLTEKTDELFKYVKDVQRLYKVFLDFFKNAEKYESTELRDFANVATTFSLVELKATIEKLHEALVDVDVRRQSILSIISKDSSAADTMCIRGESSQQLIHQLYETVAYSDQKGLMVTLYSYSLKEKYENRSYAFRKSKEIEAYHARISDTFSKVKKAMAVASREVWKCDPPKHKKEETYTKLQEVFQGFFMYEPDTTRSNWHAAFHTCSALTDDRLRCNSENCKAQPAERRCTGHMRDCQQISHYMQICHSPPGSDRRYDWMKTEEGALYGRDGPCNNTQGLWEIPPYLLSICACNCESENREIPRYISLQDVTSDVHENKVITGARFVKNEYVFYIQIQQAKLEANGTITEIPEWKNVTIIPTSAVLSNNVSTYHYIVTSYPHQNNDHELKYEEWVEFHKNDIVYPITYKYRTVYLDDLDASPNELLTGLRFRRVNDDFRLEIQTTPFDYATGALKKEESSWTARSNTFEQRGELVLTDPDDPSRWLGSDAFSHNNQFVRFRMTDLQRDLGQYTVPFIDLQEITTNPPLPMSGAGIFHKGKLHSGGFLSLKLIHYDFTPHL